MRGVTTPRFSPTRKQCGTVRALEHAKVGIVVAGNQWLTADSFSQKPRLFEATDTVHLEVRALLGGRRTVLVLLADRPALNAAELPDDLTRLADIQAIHISHENWHSAFPKVLLEVRGALRTAARLSA